MNADKPSSAWAAALDLFFALAGLPWWTWPVAAALIAFYATKRYREVRASALAQTLNKEPS